MPSCGWCADYFASAPDPDRGYALAALTGDLVFRHAKAGLFRELAAARTDPSSSLSPTTMSAISPRPWR